MRTIFTEIGRKAFLFTATILLLSLVTSIVGAAETQDSINETLESINETLVNINEKLTKKPLQPDDWKVLCILVGVVVGTFAALILIGYKNDKALNKGEMRRAIAGSFVVGFTVLVILSAWYEFESNNLVTAYIQLAGVVIGFYFGSKTALEKPPEGASGKPPEAPPEVPPEVLPEAPPEAEEGAEK